MRRCSVVDVDHPRCNSAHVVRVARVSQVAVVAPILAPAVLDEPVVGAVAVGAVTDDRK